MRTDAFNRFVNQLAQQFPNQQLPAEISNLITELEKDLIRRDVFLANQVLVSLSTA